MATPPLIMELRAKVRAAERELLSAQAQAQRAEERAQLAERSAREAWAFARTISRAPWLPASRTNDRK